MADSTWTGLAGDNDWNNPGNWDAGVPGIGDTATLPGGGAPINGNIPQLSNIALIAGSQTLTGNIVNFGVQFVTAPGATLVLSGVISGTSLSVIVTGSGTVALVGANTFTGTLTLGGGTLAAGNAAAFGNATVQVSGGPAALDLGGLPISNPIAYGISDSGPLNAGNYAGQMTLQPGVTLTLPVNNPYASGATVVVLSGSTLNGNGKLCNFGIDLSGGSLANVTGFTGPLSVGAGATLNINAGVFGSPSSVTCDGGTINGGGAPITRGISMQAGTLTNGSIDVANLVFPALTDFVTLEVTLSGTATLTLPPSSHPVILFSPAPSFTGDLSIGEGTTFDLAAPIGGGTYAGAISGGGNIRLNGPQILSGVITSVTVKVATPIGNAEVTNPGNSSATVDVIGAGSGFRATVAGAVRTYRLHDGTLDLNGLDATNIYSYGGSVANGDGFIGALLAWGPQDGSSGVTTLSPGPGFGPPYTGETNVDVGFGGTLVIPIGASVVGKVFNNPFPNAGTGTVIVEDDGTPRTPMGIYQSRCGSTYAVRQF